ncbi:hypothetical protein GCM10010145_60160 [Streptomyces ruber]|uniref:Uncharacterized protein n=2 Tax=Streptomyces TaxID=1883 RepID=A0A918BNQ3_9ACTN|nr:hypothetical protein GCM10010145_60160 [Streptomyces ruber]
MRGGRPVTGTACPDTALGTAPGERQYADRGESGEGPDRESSHEGIHSSCPLSAGAPGGTPAYLPDNTVRYELG